METVMRISLYGIKTALTWLVYQLLS